MAVLRTHEASGGAINLAHAVPVGQTYEVMSVTVKLSAAPTTAGTLAVTLDSALGAEYDATLYSVDPSVASVTSVVWVPAARLLLAGGDAVRVTYTNADKRTCGVAITLRSV